MSGNAFILFRVTRRGLSKQSSGGSCVHHYSGRGVSATPNCLGSICKKVRYPVEECDTRVFCVEISNQFCEEDCI